LAHAYWGNALKELAKSCDLAVELAAAFDASPNAYMLLNTELRYAGVNQAYLDLTQRRRDDLLGRHVMEAFDAGGDEEMAGVLRRSFESVLKTGQADHIAVLHYTVALPDAAGELTYVDRYWSCTHSPVVDGDGALKYILQHTTDITELETLRRHAGSRRNDDRSALDTIVSGRILQRAESIQQDRRRVEAERNRLLEMFMQAPGFMAVLTGPEHVFEMHNAAYGQLVAHREIVGKTIREALPDLSGQGYYELLDSVFATGEPYEGRRSRVELQPTPDARPETVYLDFIYQPIRGGDRKSVV
jgi:hypothetical protein